MVEMHVDRAMNSLLGGERKELSEGKQWRGSGGTKSLHLPYHHGAAAIAKDKKAADEKLSERGADALATPSLGMMALYAETGKGNSIPTDQVLREAVQMERVKPGAVAVCGLNHDVEGDLDNEAFIITTTESGTTPMYPDFPIAAELIENNDENYERIEKELCKHSEQLQQVLAERENTAVAQVIDTSESSKAIRGQRIKWMVAIGLILVVVGIVLGVVIPMSSATPSPTPPPQDLIDLLSAASLYGVASLQNPSTPQNEALMWLANNIKLKEYSDEKKI